MLKKWITKGFDDFSAGKFGNGGQNIYVSKRGVLQRVYHYDVNKDGYFDLLFSNGQDMEERVPAFLYQKEKSGYVRKELPTHGAYSATVADLSGEGHLDLIIANQNDGATSNVCAQIYPGNPEGISGNYLFELPVPDARAVAAGDFNGDGKQELVFYSDGKLQLFYQNENGFAPRFSQTIPIDDIVAVHAADIDKDGFCDLFVRIGGGSPRVFWGSPDGLDPNRSSTVGSNEPFSHDTMGTTLGRPSYYWGWTPKVIDIGDERLLFRVEESTAVFYRNINREFSPAFCLDCQGIVSVACVDVDHDGWPDIVAVVCTDISKEENSIIFWGSKDGYSLKNTTELKTQSARDAAVFEDEDTCIAICQGKTDTLLSTHSLVYRLDGRMILDCTSLETHDATRVFVAGSSTKPQLIFVNHEGGRTCADINAYLYYGGPDGYNPDRKAELPAMSATDCNCCDFNDDGWADILLCNSSDAAYHLDPGSFIYYGSPSGFKTDNKCVLPTIRCVGAAVGDFRHSGYLDIVMAGSYNAELLLFHGTHDGFDISNPERILLDPDCADYTPYKVKTADGWREFDNDARAKKYREPRYLYTADFNNDGWLDIFVSEILGDYSYILWGGPEGFSLDNSQRVMTENAVCANAADFTGNGWLDLVVGSFYSSVPDSEAKLHYDSYVTVYYGGPNGYSEYRKTQLPANAATSIAVADFNNDGFLDIFVTSYHNGRSRDTDAFFYWGDAQGAFDPTRRSRLFNHSGSGCVAADFDENGYIDLAVASHKAYGNHKCDSFVFRNGPDGFLKDGTLRLPTEGPHGMMPVDPGNILDRTNEEYYISAIHSFDEVVSLKSLSFKAQLPPKTWVKLWIRAGNTKQELLGKPFTGSTDEYSWYTNGDNIVCSTCKYSQFKLSLGSVNGAASPRLSEVILDYESA